MLIRTGKNNLPIADRRVPNKDLKYNRVTYFGTNPLPVEIATYEPVNICRLLELSQRHGKANRRVPGNDPGSLREN